MTTQFWEKILFRWRVLIFGALAIALGFLIGIGVGLTPNIFLPIAAGLGSVVAILSLTNLEFGLLVFIIITYLRVSDIAVNYYNAPSIARPFFFLLVVAVVLNWAITKKNPKGWLTPAVLILAYGLIIFGSIFYATDFSSAQAAADDYWKDGLIAVLVAALIQKKSTFRHVIWALLLSGIFVGTISVIQYLTGTFSNTYFGFAQAPLLQIVGETQGNRVAGQIGDPNFYAQIMVVLVPLAINRMLSEKSTILKLLAGYGLLVISLTIIFTFSRGGFFALLTALLVLAFYRPPRLPLLVIFLAGAWVIILLLPSSFLDRMGTITDLLSGQQDVRTESSFRGRASELIAAWQMFADHPIMGVGIKNYPAYYLQYSRQLGLDSRTTQREPHNLFLEIAAETGIMGLLAFGSILFFIFRYVNYARKSLEKSGDIDFKDLVGAYSASMIGYLAAAMFIHGAYPRYLWLLAGIAFALPNIVKNET